MLAVFRRELRAYFLSPTGYIFMGFFLLLSGFFFAFSNLFPASPSYINVLGSITFIFLIAVPILTMRLLSEESRQKTDQLLLTSPLGVTGMVLGKYFAAVGMFLITLLATCLYPIILSFFGTIAVWEVVGGYIGFFLLGSAFISIGLFVSSLTDNQVIAAVVTFSALLFIWILDWVLQGLPTDRASGIVFACVVVAGIVALVYFSIRNIFVSVVIALIGLGSVAALYITNEFFL